MTINADVLRALNEIREYGQKIEFTPDQRTRLRQWAEDLENPPVDVQQGRGRLRYIEDGIKKDCCLGRVCDLHDPSLWQPEGANAQGQTYDWKYTGTPPGAVDTAFGIAGLSSYFAALNDEGELTFKEIACVIQQYLLREDDDDPLI